MAYDLLIDQITNDLVISDSDLKFTTKKEEELSQRLGIRLRTFETEWFINQSYGIPYLQQIISQARNKRDVDTIFISEIREEEGVNALSNYSSTWDKITREYSFTTDVTTSSGTIPISILTKPSEEWIYPDSGDDNSRVDCEFSDIQFSANRLYYFINRDGLPKNTYATWINGWS